MTPRRAALIRKALLKHYMSEVELVLIPCPYTSSRSFPLLVIRPLTSPPSHTLGVNKSHTLPPAPLLAVLSGPAWPS